ncbi:MAG: hypothetical protein C4527_15925 [Candidatus Omnitrophota bacterium]|jgi:hypothetical protein|nr:MAG: hypothetical protein C4527_15925 [Candidatus Omnitrophota bacterium]
MSWFYTAIKYALQHHGYKVFLTKGETLPGGCYQKKTKGFDAVVILPEQHPKHNNKYYYVAEIKTHQEITESNYTSTDKKTEGFNKVRKHYRNIYKINKTKGNFCIAIAGQAEYYYSHFTKDPLDKHIEIKDKYDYNNTPNAFREEKPQNLNNYKNPERMFIIDSIDKEAFDSAIENVKAKIVWQDDFSLLSPLDWIRCSVYIYDKPDGAKWPKWYDYYFELIKNNQIKKENVESFIDSLKISQEDKDNLRGELDKRIKTGLPKL